MLIAWGILIFTLLYVYALLIFYLVTKEGKLSIILVHGFKSMILLHKYIASDNIVDTYMDNIHDCSTFHIRETTHRDYIVSAIFHTILSHMG